MAELRAQRLAYLDPPAPSSPVPSLRRGQSGALGELPPLNTTKPNAALSSLVRQLSGLSLSTLPGTERMNDVGRLQEQTHAKSEKHDAAPKHSPRDDLKTMRPGLEEQRLRLNEFIEMQEGIAVDAAMLLIGNYEKLINPDKPQGIAEFAENISNQISEMKSSHAIKRPVIYEFNDIARCQIRQTCLVSSSEKVRGIAQDLQSLYSRQYDGVSDNSLDRYEKNLRKIETKIGHLRDDESLNGAEKYQLQLLLDDTMHLFGLKEELVHKIEFDGFRAYVVAGVYGIKAPEDLKLLDDTEQNVKDHGPRAPIDRMIYILQEVPPQDRKAEAGAQKINHPKDLAQIIESLQMR